MTAAASIRRILAALLALSLPPAAFAERITFSADSMTGRNGSKADDTKLIGDAFVKTETMEIKAEEITLSGENFRYIAAEGRVEGANTESELTFSCGRMRYDRTTKTAVLEDSVHLIDTKNSVTADAQIIEYNQDTDVAVMQIGVKIVQKDNTCTAAHAIYRKREQTLDMSGNPRIVQGEDTFRAQEISLNLETDEITLDGRVSGTVTDSKKNSDGGVKADVPPAADGKPEAANGADGGADKPKDGGGQKKKKKKKPKTEKKK